MARGSQCRPGIIGRTSLNDTGSTNWARTRGSRGRAAGRQRREDASLCQTRRGPRYRSVDRAAPFPTMAWRCDGTSPTHSAGRILPSSHPPGGRAIEHPGNQSAHSPPYDRSRRRRKTHHRAPEQRRRRRVKRKDRLVSLVYLVCVACLVTHSDRARSASKEAPGYSLHILPSLLVFPLGG